jgi:hypothetical protein
MLSKQETHQIADALYTAGEHRLALACYRELHEYHAPTVTSLTGAALCYRELGDLDSAEYCLGRAIAKERTPQRIMIRACILYQQGKIAEAEKVLRNLAIESPDYADGHAQLGDMLCNDWFEGGPDELLAEAREHLEKAIATDHNNVTAWSALLTSHERSADQNCWLPLASHCWAAHPGEWRYQLHLAKALLQAGDYERGFSLFARQWYCRPEYVRDNPLLQHLMWTKGQPPGPIIVWNPEGAGDGFHLARLFSHAEREGAGVKLVVNEAEWRLYESSGIDVIDARRVPMGRHSTLHNLAAQFAGELTQAPWGGPYLRSDDNEAEYWRDRFARQLPPAFRVGLAWQGNGKHQMDKRRSFAFSRLEPVLQAQGVCFVGLQKQMADLGPRVKWLSDHYDNGDWATTAAVIANLDLVITADTGIAHLAGAMGKPVWIALSDPCCWRWGRTGDHTPWYPSARLFRQSNRGSWDGVFETMAKTLKQQLNNLEAA